MMNFCFHLKLKIWPCLHDNAHKFIICEKIKFFFQKRKHENVILNFILLLFFFFLIILEICSVLMMARRQKRKDCNLINSSSYFRWNFWNVTDTVCNLHSPLSSYYMRFRHFSQAKFTFSLYFCFYHFVHKKIKYWSLTFGKNDLQFSMNHKN